MSIFLTTIIPTYDRPQYLARAILSALNSWPGANAEVIVIPNGERATWKPISEKFGLDARVKWRPIKQANVSAARNHGIEKAEGKIIRFLDDDDFLIPDVAYAQCIELLESSCDLSTYAGKIEDKSGIAHQVIAPDQTQDYGVAVLGRNCPAITFATVYRRELIKKLRWNEGYSCTEDEDWMRQVVQEKDPAWIARNLVVGVWFQHPDFRLSQPVPAFTYYRNRTVSIFRTISTLESQDRLTSSRVRAAADGLWSAVHGGFYFAPIYWTKVAERARQLDPNSCPHDPVFRRFATSISPILLEWLMLPKRWINHFMRLAKGFAFGWDPIRKI